MKNFIYFLFITTILIVGCKEESIDKEEELTLSYVSDITPSLNCLSQEYEQKHSISLRIHNSYDLQIRSIHVNVQYQGVSSTSNQVVLTTKDLPLPELTPYDISFEFTTLELRSGLSIDGVPMPPTDMGMALGGKFILTYDLEYVNNTTVRSSEQTTINLLPRLEGTYLTEDSYFYPFGPYDDFQVNIRAVILTEYIVEAFGSFDITTHEENWIYFYVDDENLVHTPLEYMGETQNAWGMDPLVTPSDHPKYSWPTSLPNEVFVGDDDLYRIRYNIGYFRESGVRIFQQTLRKTE